MDLPNRQVYLQTILQVDKRNESLKFFADRGHAQVLAGYYDKDPQRIVEWLQMAGKARGVCGVMYTTWRHDYSKLEEFIKHVRDFEAGRPSSAK